MRCGNPRSFTAVCLDEVGSSVFVGAEGPLFVFSPAPPASLHVHFDKERLVFVVRYTLTRAGEHRIAAFVNGTIAQDGESPPFLVSPASLEPNHSRGCLVLSRWCPVRWRASKSRLLIGSGTAAGRSTRWGSSGLHSTVWSATV